METSGMKGGEGTMLGRYRLVTELGRGGMARVYLALTQGPGGFNKLAVVKQILPACAEEPEYVTMFLDEARLAARIRHRNVVQTNEVGEDGGRYFMVMEYLEGQSLNRIRMRLGRAQALPLALHLRVLIDVLAGLHAAHELADYDGRSLGVVHRDVSPDNVFVTYDGAVKVVDFGIAKARDAVNETVVGTVKGKVSYMSPEQALGKSVDPRADVFAVGVMLWEAATGVRMWKGVPHSDILQRVAAYDVPLPRSVSPELPDRLDAIIRKATAPHREARYTTAAELQAELESLLAELGDHAHPRELGAILAVHFEAERAQIKVAVDEELRALPRPDRTAHALRLPVLDQPTPQPAERSAGASTPTLASAQAPATEVPSARVRTLRGAIAGAALLGGAMVLGGVISLCARGGTAQAAARVPATMAVPASVAAPVGVTAHLRVSATPPSARIWLDDQPLAGNPIVLELPVSDAEHQLRIEASGYAPRVERLTLGRDRAMDVALTPVAQALDPALDANHWSGAPSASSRAHSHKSRRLDGANPYLQ